MAFLLPLLPVLILSSSLRYPNPMWHCVRGKYDLKIIIIVISFVICLAVRSLLELRKYRITSFSIYLGETYLHAKIKSHL